MCKTNIFSVNSGVFDTRLKILTPAPLVVLVTNIRYGYRVGPCYGVSLCYAVIVTMCYCVCCVIVLAHVLVYTCVMVFPYVVVYFLQCVKVLAVVWF